MLVSVLCRYRYRVAEHAAKAQRDLIALRRLSAGVQPIVAIATKLTLEYKPGGTRDYATLLSLGKSEIRDATWSPDGKRIYLLQHCAAPPGG